MVGFVVKVVDLSVVGRLCGWVVTAMDRSCQELRVPRSEFSAAMEGLRRSYDLKDRQTTTNYAIVTLSTNSEI